MRVGTDQLVNQDLCLNTCWCHTELPAHLMFHFPITRKPWRYLNSLAWGINSPPTVSNPVFQQTTKSGTWGADSHRSCFTFGCKPVSQMLCEHFRWGRLKNFGPPNEAEMLGNEAKNSSFTGDRLGLHDKQQRQPFFESEQDKIHDDILHKTWLNNNRCNLMCC